jgi:hypothetical protein
MNNMDNPFFMCTEFVQRYEIGLMNPHRLAPLGGWGRGVPAARY